MAKPEHPDFFQHLRSELGSGRRWLDRAVVMVFPVLAGLAVVALTWLFERAFAGFEALRAWA